MIRGWIRPPTMAAPTAYNDGAHGLDIGGQLFAGKKFFVLQRVPSRLRLLDDIRANGGEVVVLEKLADYVIADHLRPKYCPPGSLSYEFVEKSIKEGALRATEDHLAGLPLGEAREAGAVHQPTKASRSAYTAEDDRILFQWVRNAEESGGLSGGNEIYKRLEAEVCARRRPHTSPARALTMDSTPTTPGSHGVTAISRGCAVALHLLRTPPALL